MLVSQLQPQDLVITLLGTYMRNGERRVWSGGLVRLLGELGFSVAASRVALARLVARGLLAREHHGRFVHYRVTARCAALLQEGDARIFALGRPARRPEPWTVLWHVIPDERRLERGRLARRLRFLGFGPLQDGTWIAARNREREVAALLDDLGVTAYAGVMVGKPAASLDFAGVAGRVWDIEGLDERYGGFIDAFGPYATSHRTARLDDRAAFRLRTLLVDAFREFPLLDPELPSDVVAAPAHRTQAVSVFHRLYRSLRTPSQRHFDAVATP